MAENTQIEWLTPLEVAEELKIAESTLRKWRMRNYGPVYSKWGGRVMYTRENVVKFQTTEATVG